MIQAPYLLKITEAHKAARRAAFAISEAKLWEWVQATDHGDSLVYARTNNGSVPNGLPGFVAASRAHDRGLVALVTKRVDGEIHYIAQRTARKVEGAP